MGYSLLSCLYISGEIESDCMEQQFHHYFHIQRVCVCVCVCCPYIQLMSIYSALHTDLHFSFFGIGLLADT